VSNLIAHNDYLNGNYIECLKQLILEIKTYLSELNIPDSAALIGQLNALSTDSSGLSLVTSSPSLLNNTNEFIFSLLKATQNLSTLFDTLPVFKNSKNFLNYKTFIIYFYVTGKKQKKYP